MKITPLSSGTGNPGTVLGTVETGQTVSRDRRVNAARAFQGLNPVESAPETLSPDMVQKKRVLRMKTNATPERYLQQDSSPIEEQNPPDVAPHTVTANTNEDAQEAEATKPLSPQFAALARQRRELQLARQAFESEKKASETQKQTSTQPDYLSQLKSDPLSVLQEAGVLDSSEFYDALTARIMGNQDGSIQMIRALEAKVASLEKGVDTKLSDRDAQVEKQALAAIRREADIISAKDDAYEMVRTTRSQPEVVELIHRTYKETGELMDTTEALQLIEEDLLGQVTKLAKAKKIQSQFNQATVTPGAQPRQMTTLTNAHGQSIATISRRDRAIAAAEGRLKR